MKFPTFWSVADALSLRMRARRFQKFRAMTAPLPRPLRIIDVGGTNWFWEQGGWAGADDVSITLVNLDAEPRVHRNIETLGGGFGRLAEFGDGAFDVAFSNSVIEHLFTYDAQVRMAGEMRRVGRRYWVQTPNFWFPIEPHFHVLGWQWMPLPMRVALLRRFRCGWNGPERDPEKARRAVEEVRLLSGREMRRLFPDGSLWAERWCGLAKSWVAFGGWSDGTR